jgi:hypothetical protein
MTQHYIARKIVTAWPEEKDGVAGYAVKYRDGYRSWCPKEKFEEDNIALGHALGSHPYEQQLIMAQVVELEQRLLAIANESGDLAQMERDVIVLHQDILKKRIEEFDLSREVVEETPKEIESGGKPHRPYFIVPFGDIKDFNIFRAAASTVPTEKEIADVRLIEVLQGGHRLEVDDALWGRVEGGIQLAGRLAGIGIFNMVVDDITGNINAASRPASSGSFADVVFALEVTWTENEKETADDGAEPAEA